MKLLQRLDPRRRLAAAMGWAVFTVVTAAALLAAWGAAREAELRARADAQGLLAEYAIQVRDAMSLNIEARRGLLLATAAQLSALRDDSPAALLRVLEAAQAQVPEFMWMGVADARGSWLVASGEPQWAAARPPDATWFRQGRRAPVVDDQRALPGGEGERLVELAVPLGAGRVLAATLPWPWVEAQLGKMQQALGSPRSVQLMMAARDGTLLLAPPPWQGLRLRADTDLTESGRFEVGRRSELRMADGVGLGWTGVVRQDAALTLAPARQAGRRVFAIVFAAGLVAAALAVLATRVLTRRLGRLAVAAEAVRRREQGALAPAGGLDEVGRIGATLASVVAQLQADKAALQRLNSELDDRVAERTRRIEQLADEARQAAVNRERLRLARDLHDTLAHSLMSLLTQVRLVRKLRRRMDDAELDGELARAEEAAADGLRGARQAITRMRDHGVREAGLPAVLRDLARRFEERSGTATRLDTHGVTGAWADERAEAVLRVAEEALRNIERHARATEVSLTLSGDLDGTFSLRVTDDGVGFDPAGVPAGHFGLQGMHEQAALLGARLEVESRHGAGSEVRLLSYSGSGQAAGPPQPASGASQPA